MVDWIQIVPILRNKVKQIKMFGDPMQIGNIDMSNTAGRRHRYCIVDYCKNIKK